MKALAQALLVALALSAPTTECFAGDRASASARVDDAFEQLRRSVAATGRAEVLDIDHARLAEAVGREMPPAHVLLFGMDEAVGSIVRGNVRAALDLPYRVLAYDDGSGVRYAYTDAAFLQARHALAPGGALEDFRATIDSVVARLAPATPVPTRGLSRDHGVIALTSSHGFAETVARLTAAVRAQDDTLWFGAIDFAAAARTPDRPATLLLFGGPAPGAVAMAEFPALGLDAFCQKLLVYRDAEGRTQVIFNSIVALAQLHYGRSAPPHAALDRRLTETFAAAIR